MATIMCQGLQSCLDSQIIEPMSIRLRLTLPNPPHFSQFFDVPSKSSLSGRSNKGSEMQETPKMTSSYLANPIPPVNKKDFAYVPPMAKSASSIFLREKSLEMCTEDLGNETGIVDHVSESMVLPSAPTDGSRSNRNPLKHPDHVGAKEPMLRSFPPPLTTITGVRSLQVKPRREDGRLVIEAIKTPSGYPHFQAERSDGRLRLCFLREPTSSCVDPLDDDEERIVDEDMAEDDEKDCEENAFFEEEMDNDNDRRDDASGDVKEFFHRTRRCTGREPGIRSLSTWEPYWVATS